MAVPDAQFFERNNFMINKYNTLFCILQVSGITFNIKRRYLS